MIEEQLRETFVRHEADAPEVGALRLAIERLWLRRRKRRRVMRTGAAAVMVVALAIGVVPTAVARVSGGLVTLPGAVDIVEPLGPLNLLLLGHDGQRADAIMLVHVSADRQKAYIVSIERDTLVDIPGHQQGKINSAYYFGGVSLTVAVVGSLTGVPIDGTVTVSLGALKRITNILGGVPICLPNAISSVHTRRTYAAGCRMLDGDAALDLSRQRFSLPDGGYGRDRTNQRVLIGVAAKVSELDLLSDVDKMMSLIKVPGVTVDFGQLGVAGLAGQLRDIDPDDLVGLSQPTFNPVRQDETHIGERMDPIVGPELFAAVRTDTLDEFATAHPSWVLR